jgi:enoyl-CoA hydratase/carnithine racemase
MGDEPHVRFEMRGPTALLTLTRPGQLNAYTTRMGRELEEAFASCDEDDAIRAIVVTGAGRAFCAGADLSSGADTFDDVGRGDAGGERPHRTLLPWQVRKPIIAAINGHAVGVGLTLTLQWDLRIAAREAKLGFLFVRRGIVPEAGSTWTAPRILGLARAAELMMTGRTVLGEEAARIGLVNEAVPAPDVVPRALAIAEEIATHAAPLSVALAKRMLWEHLAHASPGPAMLREGRALWWIGKHADAREGVAAFLEKRAPQWTGRPSAEMPDLDDG